jgi:hypothetical protein
VELKLILRKWLNEYLDGINRTSVELKLVMHTPTKNIKLNTICIFMLCPSPFIAYCPYAVFGSQHTVIGFVLPIFVFQFHTGAINTQQKSLKIKVLQ